MRVNRRELVIDVVLMALTGALVAIDIVVTDDPVHDDAPDLFAGFLAAGMVLPQLLRRRWPLTVLLLVAASLMAYYSGGYPGIQPWIPMAVPVYTAALAGRYVWTVFSSLIFLVGGSIAVAAEQDLGAGEVLLKFAPDATVLALAMVLAEAVRSRRALAAETQARLRHAAEERERETAHRVAEERLRIARELHDTVAHSMATITVQAGSALHVMEASGTASGDNVRSALTAIRETGKDALSEMRATLATLRDEGESGASPDRTAGLDRLPGLLDAIRAAGLPVNLETRGAGPPVDAEIGHAAYRVAQESLTNVLRHAGPGVRASLRISYTGEELALEITDDGPGPPDGCQPGNGLRGMRERVTAFGGRFSAGPGGDGGFTVVARLPVRAGEGGGT